MIGFDIYPLSRTALAFCPPLIRDRTVNFVDDWPGDGPESEAIGERRAFEEFLDGNPDSVAEELGSDCKRGKIYLVTRVAGVRRDRISSKTSRPTAARGG